MLIFPFMSLSLIIFNCVLICHIIDIIKGFKYHRLFSSNLHAKRHHNYMLQFSSSTSSLSSTPLSSKTTKRNNGTSSMRIIPLGQVGMGSKINEFIINYFSANAANSNNFMKLKSFLHEYELQLTYVHAITLMQQCTKHKISLANVIPLAYLDKILNSSINKKVRKVYSSRNH